MMVNEKANNQYYVIHPLDDEIEEKVKTDDLGLIKMSAGVKYSLLSLRIYLILMAGIIIYRGLHEMGLF